MQLHTAFGKFKTLYCGSNHVHCHTAKFACSVDLFTGKCECAIGDDAEHIRCDVPCGLSIQCYVFIVGSLLFPTYAGSRIACDRTCYGNTCSYGNLLAVKASCHSDYW